jgi:hypothetical protein
MQPPPWTQLSRATRPLALAALVVLVATVATVATVAGSATGRSPESAESAESAASAVHFSGPAVRIARPFRFDGLGRIASTPTGGLAVAYTIREQLVIGRYDADLRREALRSLGSLGYSGTSNISSLVALAPTALAASWSTDHHYAGFQRSYWAFVTPAGIRRGFRESCCPPMLVGDRNGGAVGLSAFLARDSRVRTRFESWDAAGNKTREKVLPGAGYPLDAQPFAGGALILRQQEPGKVRWMESLEFSGRIRGTALSVGTALATDGQERIAELALSPARTSVVARLRDGLEGHATSHRLASAPAGGGIATFAFAMDPGGIGLLAWTVYPQPERCTVRVRAFAPDGTHLGEVLCATDRGLTPRVAASSAGEFWLAWQESAQDAPDRVSILVSKASVE